MSLYDEVLNCPDTHCRKKALDRLCKEKIVEGMRNSAILIVTVGVGDIEGVYQRRHAEVIRQAAADLEAK